MYVYEQYYSSAKFPSWPSPQLIVSHQTLPADYFLQRHTSSRGDRNSTHSIMTAECFTMSAHLRLPFHTRGDRAPPNDSYIIINQAYVQYLEPRGKEFNTCVSTIVSILFVHGGGLT